MTVKKYLNNIPATLVNGGKRRYIFTENLMSVLLEFDHGPQQEPDPYHSHPHEQTACVIEGEIYLLVEGEEKHHLKSGDMYAIPSNIKHAIQLITKSAKIVDSFTPVRKDFLF